MIKELSWVTSVVGPMTLWRGPVFCRSTCGGRAGQDLVSALENLQVYRGRILSQRGESHGTGLSRTGQGRQGVEVEEPGGDGEALDLLALCLLCSNLLVFQVTCQQCRGLVSL